jgi:hypothetical protein
MNALTLTLTHEKQISPDKVWIEHDPENVNFPCTTTAFTLSPEPLGFVMSCPLTRRLSLGYPLVGDAVSVRRLALSHSGFLSTHPHGYALAFGSYFC